MNRSKVERVHPPTLPAKEPFWGRAPPISFSSREHSTFESLPQSNPYAIHHTIHTPQQPEIILLTK
jgi:hypothetical protein